MEALVVVFGVAAVVFPILGYALVLFHCWTNVGNSEKLDEILKIMNRRKDDKK